jgi:hypothetical protein
VLRRILRLAALTCVLASVAADASADFLLTPFLGSAFGGSQNVATFDGAQDSKLAVGASAAWLSRGIVGLEGDVGYSPRFFEGNHARGLASPHSRIVTMTGNVLLTLPVSVTRESLRPYVAAGLGLINATTKDKIALVPVNRHLVAMDIGGGAIGFLDPNVGVRFDLRRFSSLASGDSLGPGIGGNRFSFWRATVGVTIRY